MRQHQAARLAATAVAQFAVFRHGDAAPAARDHARTLSWTSGWSFEAHDLLEPPDPLTPLADSPAALSAALVDWLLGRHPATRKPLPASGLVVSEVDWSEWLRWGGEPPGAAPTV
jgi:hypothetical protein